MNGTSNSNPQFNFNGKVFNSIEELPAEERAKFEAIQTRLANQYPGQNINQIIANRLGDAEAFESRRLLSIQADKPAWGGVEGSPAVPKGFDGVVSLGEIVESYLAKKFNMMIMLVIGVVVFIAGGAMDLVTLAAYLFSKEIPTFPDLFGSGTFFLIVGGFIWIIPAVSWLIQRSRPTAVVLYQDGFAYRKQGQVFTVAWANVGSIISQNKWLTNKRGGWTYHRAFLIFKNGGSLILEDNQFEECVKLVANVKTQVYALLQPPAESAYQAGSDLVFGPVKISKVNGIEAQEHLYAWMDVLKVEVKNGRLIITTRDEKTVQVKAEKIPNIEVLCQLIGVPQYSIDLSYF